MQDQPSPYATEHAAARSDPVLDDATVTYLREALAGIRYGRVTLRVEDGRVVSIDTERRTRARREPQ